MSTYVWNKKTFVVGSIEQICLNWYVNDKPTLAYHAWYAVSPTHTNNEHQGNSLADVVDMLRSRCHWYSSKILKVHNPISILKTNFLALLENCLAPIHWDRFFFNLLLMLFDVTLLCIFISLAENCVASQGLYIFHFLLSQFAVVQWRWSLPVSWEFLMTFKKINFSNTEKCNDFVSVFFLIHSNLM